jgi:hypothetical protein
MEPKHLTEETFNDFRDFKHFFPGEEISCMAIFASTIMTLLVLFQLSVIC